MTILIGRDPELEVLKQRLANAMAGRGATVLISGEAGIGKTTLIESFKAHAESEGVNILSGAAPPGSSHPFQIFSKALDMSLILSCERMSFRHVFLLGPGGEIVPVSSPSDGDTGDAEIFAGMLSAVQGFVQDSFGGGGTLGRIEYGGMTILVEQAGQRTLVASFDREESPEMREAVASAARRIASEPDSATEAIEKLAGMRFIVRTPLDGGKLENERLRVSNIVLDAIKARAAKVPVLAAIEDVHWADESSLFVLRYLARNLGDMRCLLLITVRPSEGIAAQKTLSAIREESPITELVLRGLDLGGVRGMVDSALGPNQLPLPFTETLQRDCAGNPFFVRELLRQMVADGAVAWVDGFYRLVTEDYAVPSSVGEVVERRLASLDPDAMALAEYVSCIGREFPLDTALSVSSIENPESAFEKLEKSAIVTRGKGTGAFSHALFQSAVYLSLSPRWKSAHHRSIGEHCERAFAGREDEAIYDLARHFSLGGDRGKTHTYCVRAAGRAESEYAIEQAIKYLETARETCDDSLKRASLTERLGDLFFTTSSFDDAMSSYMAVMPSASNARKSADLRCKMANVELMRSSYDIARKECAIGLELLLGEECVEAARLLTTLGRIEVIVSEYDKAIGNLTKAREISKNFGARKEMAQAEHLLGSVFFHKGDYASALGHMRVAAAVRREIDDPSGLSASVNNIGNVHAKRGEWGLALTAYKESAEIDRKLGDGMGMANTLTNIASVYQSMGRPRDAVAPLLESVDVGRRVLDWPGTVMALVNLNTSHYMMGEYDEAFACVNEALELSERHGLKYESMYCYENLCLVLIAKGDSGRALIMAEKALAVAREIGARDGEAMSLLSVGKALKAGGNRSQALVQLETAFNLIREMGNNLLPEANWELGSYWIEEEFPKRARPYLESALDLYVKNGDARNIEKCRKALEEMDK